ncbi:MAG: DsbA family protein [Alphaproteobacteria bacterium]|nr:DsbA family protein [Alphaproteobacteria bacterium]
MTTAKKSAPNKSATKAKKAAKPAAAAPAPVAKPAPVATPAPVAAPAPVSTTTIGLVLGALLTGGVIATALQSSVVPSSPGNGQSAATDAQIEAYIRANPELILTVVREYSINKEKESKAQAVNLVKTNDGKTVFGNPDGDITIYEFSDYNCGYCKRSFGELMELVQADGNIRVVIKEMPILSQSSYDAAMLSLAAAELGRYDEAHAALMQWPGQLDDAALDQIVADLGLDKNELQEIAASDAIQDILSQNREAAEALGVSGTPAFVIGDEFIPGAMPKDQIEALIADIRNGES